MDGEDGRHQRAGPETARHPPKNHQQQDRRSGVQQHVDQVMGRGAVPQKCQTSTCERHVSGAQLSTWRSVKRRQDARAASSRR